MQNMINAVCAKVKGTTEEVISAAANTKGFILHMAGTTSAYNGGNAEVLVDDKTLLVALGHQNTNGHSSNSLALPHAMLFPKDVSLKISSSGAAHAWCWYEVLT